MKLRLRVDDDWPSLLDVWVASWRATYPEIDFEARRDWLMRHVRDLEAVGGVTLCLFDAGATLAGFVVINPADGWLDQICIAPDRFGAGLGASLLSAARNVSPSVIRLDVNADNLRAIRFYERDGFSRVGRGANTLSGRETIMMEWRPQR
jgi:putative acetyltransferase